MKKLFGPLVKKIVTVPILWSLSKYFLRFAEWFRYERNRYESSQADKELKSIFSNLTVTHGYFKGLKYADFNSFGSSLFPKLSGSYESELIETFRSLEINNYKSIIDVGCAEGFYAVGLALKHSNAEVVAFDIDERARGLCRELAIHNNVIGRVEIKDACHPDWLQKLDPHSKNFLICDCEGYERHLFNSDNCQALRNSDLLIELHPFFEPDVKEYLASLFSLSHTIKIISSLDSGRKAFELPQPFQHLSAMEKSKLVEEGRPFTMEWLIMSPKNHEQKLVN